VYEFEALLSISRQKRSFIEWDVTLLEDGLNDFVTKVIKTNYI
jgi:hypothetical protein